MLSDSSKDPTLDLIKASILAISKLLKNHPCKCEECDKTSHEEYVARAKTKLLAEAYRALDAAMKAKYRAKNQTGIEKETRLSIKNDAMRKTKADALREATNIITNQLQRSARMATGPSFR